MNKKTNRGSLRAPTVNPASSIAPSATLAEDGELPLSASNGVSAPAPLAAHDVLQAAMAPREGASADADADAAPKEDAVEPGAPEAPEAPEAGAKDAKAARKLTKPAKSDKAAGPAVKPAKEKFVKCTFALPESEMLVLDAMKKTYKSNGVALKKSQLLRAALLALADVDADRLTQLLAQLPAAPVAKKKK
jgi:hypothetical protein